MGKKVYKGIPDNLESIVGCWAQVQTAKKSVFGKLIYVGDTYIEVEYIYNDVNYRDLLDIADIIEFIYTVDEDEPASSNYETNDKMVSHPPHYQSATGLEVIDVIEAFTADLNGIEAVDTGNVIKYICRWKHKNGLQDLKKAQWYLTHLINLKEKESN